MHTVGVYHGICVYILQVDVKGGRFEIVWTGKGTPFWVDMSEVRFPWKKIDINFENFYDNYPD